MYCQRANLLHVSTSSRASGMKQQVWRKEGSCGHYGKRCDPMRASRAYSFFFCSRLVPCSMCIDYVGMEHACLSFSLDEVVGYAIRYAEPSTFVDMRYPPRSRHMIRAHEEVGKHRVWVRRTLGVVLRIPVRIQPIRRMIKTIWWLSTGWARVRRSV